jgi:membrane protein required for colicin V production
MNQIDIAILVIVGLGLIQGLFKGFIVSIASLLGLILGYYLSVRFAWYFEDLLKGSAEQGSMLTHVLAFIICFSLVVVAVHFIGKTVQKMVELTPLGIINRIMGALLGVLKGLLIVAAIIYVIEIVDTNDRIISRENKENAKFYKPLANGFSVLRSALV